MAGSWPSSFFACLWTKTKLRSINLQKRTWPIASHLDWTSLVNKGFIIWLSGKFFLQDTTGSPEPARYSSILPAHKASHIIQYFLKWVPQNSAQTSFHLGSWLNWNLELLVFKEWGKLEYPEGNPWNKARNNNNVNPHSEMALLPDSINLAPQRVFGNFFILMYQSNWSFNTPPSPGHARGF